MIRATPSLSTDHSNLSQGFPLQVQTCLLITSWLICQSDWYRELWVKSCIAPSPWGCCCSQLSSAICRLMSRTTSIEADSVSSRFSMAITSFLSSCSCWGCPLPAPQSSAENSTFSEVAMPVHRKYTLSKCYSQEEQGQAQCPAMS